MKNEENAKSEILKINFYSKQSKIMYTPILCINRHDVKITLLYGQYIYTERLGEKDDFLSLVRKNIVLILCDGAFLENLLLLLQGLNSLEKSLCIRWEFYYLY